MHIKIFTSLQPGLIFPSITRMRVKKLRVVGQGVASREQTSKESITLQVDELRANKLRLVSQQVCELQANEPMSCESTS